MLALLFVSSVVAPHAQGYQDPDRLQSEPSKHLKHLAFGCTSPILSTPGPVRFAHCLLSPLPVELLPPQGGEERAAYVRLHHGRAGVPYTGLGAVGAVQPVGPGVPPHAPLGRS